MRLAILGEILSELGCFQSTLSGDLLIKVEVQPNSSNNMISGYNELKACLKVSITAPAQKGKANKSLIHVLSKMLGVSKSSITIQSGFKSRTKMLLLVGVDIQAVKTLIQSRLE